MGSWASFPAVPSGFPGDSMGRTARGLVGRVLMAQPSGSWPSIVVNDRGLALLVPCPRPWSGPCVAPICLTCR